MNRLNDVDITAETICERKRLVYIVSNKYSKVIKYKKD